MARVQKTAVELNNMNLLKNRKTLGEGFKTLPYLVDHDYLERNLSQPKFVRKMVYPPKREPKDAMQYAPGDVK